MALLALPAAVDTEEASVQLAVEAAQREGGSHAALPQLPGNRTTLNLSQTETPSILVLVVGCVVWRWSIFRLSLGLMRVWVVRGW